MKRFFGIVCLVAMVAVFATSCDKKEAEVNPTVTFGDTYGFKAAPSNNPFGAKAYLDPQDDYKFKWNDGDQIMIYNLATDYTKSRAGVYTAIRGSEGQAHATFSGPLMGRKGDIGYFAFFNARKASGRLQADNRETFTVAETQNYNAQYLIDPTALVMAAKINGDSFENFTLEHIFGFLNVGIGGMVEGKQVANIEVTDAAFHLTGNLSLKLPAVNGDMFSDLCDQLETSGDDQAYQTALYDYLHNTLGYSAQGRTNIIRLNCGNGVTVPYHAWKYFFIPLRPGALYKGFTVRINFTDRTYAEHTFPASMDYLIKPKFFTNTYWTATAEGGEFWQ
jgi:hypothetical protein